MPKNLCVTIREIDGVSMNFNDGKLMLSVLDESGTKYSLSFGEESLNTLYKKIDEYNTIKANNNRTK